MQNKTVCSVKIFSSYVINGLNFALTFTPYQGYASYFLVLWDSCRITVGWYNIGLYISTPLLLQVFTSPRAVYFYINRYIFRFYNFNFYLTYIFRYSPLCAVIIRFGYKHKCCIYLYVGQSYITFSILVENLSKPC